MPTNRKIAQLKRSKNNRERADLELSQDLSADFVDSF